MQIIIKSCSVWWLNQKLFDQQQQQQQQRHHSHMIGNDGRIFKRIFFFFFAWLTESVTSSWLLIGEALMKLPGDRPAANHRTEPEEPCLNYKLEPHLSVTQRNQRWWAAQWSHVAVTTQTTVTGQYGSGEPVRGTGQGGTGRRNRRSRLDAVGSNVLPSQVGPANVWYWIDYGLCRSFRLEN